MEKKNNLRVWKKGAALALALYLIFRIPGTAQADESGEMISRVRWGVVQIAAIEERRDGMINSSKGTGFGVGAAGEDTDIFITNWHVVVDENGNVCDEIYIMLDNANLFDSDTLVRCKVLYTTTGYPDFAILQATEAVKGLKALPVMQSEKALHGSKVYALGYPGVTDKGVTHSTVEDITVTDGVISKFTDMRDLHTKCVIHTAHINNGNSGGPLVTIDGAVIGINTYTYAADENYSYAVYIDYVMDALDELGISYDIYEEKTDTDLESGSSGTESGSSGTESGSSGTESGGSGTESGGSGTESGGSETKSGEAEQGKGTDSNDEKWDEDKKDENLRVVLAVSGGAVLLAGAVIVCFLIHRRTSRPNEAGDGERDFSGYSVVAGDGHRIPIPVRGVMIGRDISCEICLPADTKGVSRRHCCLSVNKGVLYLKDVGSTYGTFVDRNRLAVNMPVVLNRGSSFYLGEERNRFSIM